MTMKVDIKANKYIEAKVDPIHPNNFKDMVKKRVLQLQPKFKFGENMMSGFFYYGATYNECVYRNLNGKAPMRLVIPAPTGSAKSVSAKLYLSKIAIMDYSGLLVVGKVNNAISAVKEINEIVGKRVAACTYSISSEHLDSDERVDAVALKDFPIAIITHNMFLSRSSSRKNIDLYKNYQKKQRSCVIIDEHIDFKRTVGVSTEEIKEVIGLVKDIPGWDNIDQTLKKISESEEHSELDTVSHPDISDTMHEAKRVLQQGEGYVGRRMDRKYQDREAKDRDSMIRLLDKLEHIFANQNIIVKQGQYSYLSVNEDLTNQFGSVVILDATANASPIYRSHIKNRDDIQMYEMPKGIRSYKNATLHVCRDKHRKQSNNQLVKVPKLNKNIEQIVDSYLENLYPLTADGSKLLVVTFKDIEETFRTRCEDPNVVFIHWGEHEGRNDFSEFTKASAIGWYRKGKRKYYEDIDAIQSDIVNYMPITSTIAIDAEKMITGGLAADFVQFFNRTRSRVVIDENGNCAHVDLYIFDDGSYGSPISLIEEEMPDIKVVDWKPLAAYPIIKKSKNDLRAEQIFEYLLTKPGHTIDANTILDHFSGRDNLRFSKRNFKDIVDGKLFRSLIDDEEILMRKVRGRYGGTFFDIPERFIEDLEEDKAKVKLIADMLSN